MSKECKRARNVVIGLWLTLTLLTIAFSSCSDNKVLSAHGQESDYKYEAKMDEIYENTFWTCENCDEID